jgi:argininosuccinate lyase
LLEHAHAVEGRLDSLRGGTDRIPVPDVPAGELDARRQHLARTGRIADEGNDVIATVDEAPSDCVPHLSSCAGDEDPHRARSLVLTYPGAMPRLPGEQDPLFRRLNASIDFDLRLWPQDIAGSRAHIGALRAAGVITDEELAALSNGLDAVAGELERGEFGFRDADEDIHMAIERRLTEIAGPVGGKLHTARSRNDQVATDLALYVRARAERARGLIAELMSRLLGVAEAHSDWRMPGYTHLQRAQPVYLGHHLLAYFWMLERDEIRFRFAGRSTMAMPLGSGAVAGLNWNLDRERTAEELGFARPSPNSIDAVSNRDFALDYLHAAAVCSTHLSRLGSELVLWSSQEFGFCEPADDFSSGSSIMPQKKNPDAAELLRAKAPRVVASLTTLLGVLHALPLSYSKDLQEDKEALFDAVDTLELCLEAAESILAGLRFDRERMAEAAADEMVAATDVADLLVRRGMPFREAHAVVGGLVRTAIESGRSLSDLEPDELAAHSELLDDEYYRVLEEGAWLDSKVSVGGTGAARLDQQLNTARRVLDELRSADS